MIEFVNATSETHSPMLWRTCEDTFNAFGVAALEVVTIIIIVIIIMEPVVVWRYSLVWR